MIQPSCVGALIRDDRNRVYVHRRSTTRRLLPGVWDVVGGHVEAGETPEQALAREIEEETGWTLRRIEAAIADWSWELDGTVRREIDYLVEVDGDLDAPRLEEGKHDACAWVGPAALDLLMQGRSDGDHQLRDAVARATRIRLTSRLRLEPIGHEHVDDLMALYASPAVADWYDGGWSRAYAHTRAARAAAAWEHDGADRWMAYDRATGRLVGRGGVAMAQVDGEHRLHVGWTVHPDLWGRGYATEIGRASLAFAFDDLRAEEVVALTEPHNQRSRAVAERLGMQYSHEVRRWGRPMSLYSAPAGA